MLRKCKQIQNTKDATYFRRFPRYIKKFKAEASKNTLHLHVPPVKAEFKAHDEKTAKRKLQAIS